MILIKASLNVLVSLTLVGMKIRSARICWRVIDLRPYGVHLFDVIEVLGITRLLFSNLLKTEVTKMSIQKDH